MKWLHITAFLLLFSIGFMSKSMAQTAYNTAFTTALTFQNIDATAATVTLNYYAQGGSQISLPTQVLEPGAGTTLWVGGLATIPNGSAGSIVLDSNQDVVTSLVQIPASSSPVENRMISNAFRTFSSNRVLLASALKNQFNTTSRISIQNAANAAANLTLKFYNTTSATPVATVVANNVPAGAAQYYDLGTISGLPAVFDGSVTVDGVLSSNPSTPAPIVGTALELSTNSSNAAKAFEGVGAGATTLYMATALCQFFGTDTAYAVQNVSTASANVTVNYSNGTSQTKMINAGSKQSFITCDVAGTNFSGAATITSSSGAIIAIGKAFKPANSAFSTAFLGETGGTIRLALPYVRWTSNANYNAGTRQRTAIAIQNVGSSAATDVTVKYLNKFGTVIGIHSIGTISVNQKANSNASMAGTTTELIEFGNPEANPGGGYGGAALVEGNGQLIAIARVSSIVSAGVDVAEDYNAFQLQ